MFRLICLAALLALPLSAQAFNPQPEPPKEQAAVTIDEVGQVPAAGKLADGRGYTITDGRLFLEQDGIHRATRAKAAARKAKARAARATAKPQAAPAGTYKLADGRSLTVEAESTIKGLRQAQRARRAVRKAQRRAR